MWPRQESNLDLELRRLLYYPLYYEAIKKNQQLLYYPRPNGVQPGGPVRKLSAGQALYYEAIFTLQTLRIYFPKFTILVPNIFTAIASKITPKNFLTTSKPFGPSARSIHFKEPSTKNIIKQFTKIPIKIFIS